MVLMLKYRTDNLPPSFLKNRSRWSVADIPRNEKGLVMKMAKKVVFSLIFSIGVFVFPQLAFAGSYSGSNAAVYALTYCDDYNTSYVSYEADCMNFVSQCLLAGGWSETGKYYYWSSSAWYYDGSSLVSDTWKLVEDFKDFIEGSGRASGPYTVSSSNLSSFEVGDVMLVDWTDDGTWGHAYIVTGLETNPADVELSAHTTDRCGDITTADIWNDHYPNADIIGYFLYSSY